MRHADFSNYLGPGEDPTLNQLWGAVVMETLQRCGVREVVVCPGSRSTPLTLPATRCPGLVAIPVLDERSAGFFALGLARSAGRPVALICTSGSALAHFLPAVIEASYSGVPLILLTGDRPPELQECGAGQTIDQAGIFGRFRRFEATVALPWEGESALHYLRDTVVTAVRAAVDGNPGPVHLNFPFREPLAPFPDAEALLQQPVDLERIVGAVGRVRRPLRAPLLEDLKGLRDRSRKGLLLLGSPFFLNEKAALDGVAALASWLGYPVLADVVNSARGHAGKFPGLVTAYDRILGAGLPPEAVPEVVVQIGALPTSKRLRGWLEGLRDRVWRVEIVDRGGTRDPLRLPGESFVFDPETIKELPGPEGPADGGFLDQWRHLQSSHVDSPGPGGESLNGEWLCRTVGERAMPGAVLFFANSLAVRHGEAGIPPLDLDLTLSANRGANGIDGNLSTAFGFAFRGDPVFCICGDLAFLHDSNALLLHAAIRSSLTVLVLENGGGRIFDRLPVSRVRDVYERFFVTPQDVDLGALCSAHGIAYRKCLTREEVGAALDEPFAQGCRVFGIAVAEESRLPGRP